jgi:hypothetical protein
MSKHTNLKILIVSIPPTYLCQQFAKPATLVYLTRAHSLYEGVSKSFRTESIKEYILTFGITR